MKNNSLMSIYDVDTMGLDLKRVEIRESENGEPEYEIKFSDAVAYVDVVKDEVVLSDHWYETTGRETVVNIYAVVSFTSAGVWTKDGDYDEIDLTRAIQRKIEDAAERYFTVKNHVYY